jgi:hypothetical protein
MASAQVKGVLKFYRRTPTGSMVFLYGADLAALGPSGSSDGAIASTPEKWSFIPLQNAQHKVLRVNDQLVVSVELKAAATTDASDGEAVIPITYQDGSVSSLSGFDNATDWDVKQLGDVALLANVETIIAIKKVNQPFILGSNTQKAFVSVEDDS